MNLEDSSPADVQRADQRLRMRWLGALTLVAMLGGVALLVLDAFLGGFRPTSTEALVQPAARARLATQAVLAILGVGGTVFSLYLTRISWRVWRSERYPPPGARVFSDTQILRGRPARRRGQAGLVLAALTLLLTALVVTQTHRVLTRRLDVHLKPTRIEIGALAPYSSASVGTSDGRRQISPDGGR